MKKCYKKKSTSKQIVIAVSLIFFLLLGISTLTKILSYNDIQSAQQEIPVQFFQAYDEYSLQETTTLLKQLMLNIIDYRASFITSMANAIRNQENGNMELKYRGLNESRLYGNQSMMLNCVVLRPNNTIFSCGMHLYTKYMMEGGWAYQMQRPTRRFNIIYQNNRDENDVMVKTISQDPGFQMRNISRLSRTMNRTKSGVLMISNFYQDRYGQSSDYLLSFSTKLSFANYSIIIESETFGSEFTRPLTRVIFADDPNIIIVTSKKNTSSSDYELVVSLKPIEDDIDLNLFLGKGFKRMKIGVDDVISYTVSVSSEYNIGSLNYAKQQKGNEDYNLVFYVRNMNKTIKGVVFSYIVKLRIALRQSSLVILGIIIVVAITAIGYTYYDINTNLGVYGRVIKEYMTPSTYSRMVSCKNEEIYPLIRSNSLLRMINLIVKQIHDKKREFRNKCHHHKNDQFPLNTFYGEFQKAQKWEDSQRFQELYERLQKLQRPQRIKMEK